MNLRLLEPEGYIIIYVRYFSLLADKMAPKKSKQRAGALNYQIRKDIAWKVKVQDDVLETRIDGQQESVCATGVSEDITVECGM